MPINTITEFRGRNKYRTKKKNIVRNRSSSPPRRMGNVNSDNKGFCTYCSPELFSSLKKKMIVKDTLNDYKKDILEIE